MNGHHAIIDYLVECGASIHEKDEYGKNVIIFLNIYLYLSKGYSIKKEVNKKLRNIKML